MWTLELQCFCTVYMGDRSHIMETGQYSKKSAKLRHTSFNTILKHHIRSMCNRPSSKVDTSNTHNGHYKIVGFNVPIDTL